MKLNIELLAFVIPLLQLLININIYILFKKVKIFNLIILILSPVLFLAAMEAINIQDDFHLILATIVTLVIFNASQAVTLESLTHKRHEI